MATALQLLSSLGVAHTDLKLDNVMMMDHVNQPLKIRLIDFGLARYVSPTRSNPYMQALHYRSPEVLLGFPFTTAIDIWSLGCIAAELFLGHALYHGSCEYEMLRHMEQTQGHLPKKLVRYGSKARKFFRRNRGRGRRWRLKSPDEYGDDTRSERYFYSLDDLKKVRPACHLSVEDTMAEIKDQKSFVNLLKKMLHLDADKRITPSQLLEHPFITMSNLAESYPNSFYMKSGCEMMGVCRDQSLRSDNRDQQPCLNPQDSTSTASLDQCNIPGQVIPAWHSHQENPLILELASAFSKLSILEDQRPSQPQTSTEAPAEASSSSTAAKPLRQRTRATFVAKEPRLLMSNEDSTSTASLDHRNISGQVTPAWHSRQEDPLVLELISAFSKVSILEDQRPSQPQTPKEAPAEASSSSTTAKPLRQSTRATFVAKKPRLLMSKEDQHHQPGPVQHPWPGHSYLAQSSRRSPRTGAHINLQQALHP